MQCDQAKEFLTVYLLEPLDAGISADFESHLRSCASCREELWALGETLAMLAFAAPAAVPTAHPRRQLMTRIEADYSRATMASSLWARLGFSAAPLAWATSLVLLIACMGGFWYSVHLRDRIALLQDKIGVLQQALNGQTQRMAALFAPGAKVFRLDGLGPTPDAVAYVVWNVPEKTWRVYSRNLPQMPVGKIYELWFVTPDGVQQAALFDSDKDGEAFLKVDLPASLEKFLGAAVTIERSGGVPQPEGKMVLKGSI